MKSLVVLSALSIWIALATGLVKNIPEKTFTSYSDKLTCSDQPCKNGAKCLRAYRPPEHSQTYYCFCPSGFCGKNCENEQFIRYHGYQLKCLEDFPALMSISGTIDEIYEYCHQICWQTPECESINYITGPTGVGICYLYQKAPDTCEFQKINVTPSNRISYVADLKNLQC
ncbi:uncharacterized protein LOC143250358 [Tachypleus tridentatus]|uniref:uncharacterized protein LOC143250358 n=1 Tax=Tachypleus tridentatus TaxID=6853 RepID=UPI003FD08A08